MEETSRDFDGLLSQIKTLLSMLNPIEGLTAVLFKHGVLSSEERDNIQRERDQRDDRAAGRTLVKIVEQKRDEQTLGGLVKAQDAFLRLYEQVQSKELIVDTAEQRILNAFQYGHLNASELEDLLKTCCNDCNIQEITNFEGKSLLHLACCSMLINTVTLLIEQYHFDPSLQDDDGNTPLHDACRCRKVAIVNYLLRVPTCDPNIKNSDGNTALHESIFLRHWGVCRALVASEKVDYAVRNNDGVTIFEWLEQHPQYSREKMKLNRALSNRKRLTKRQNRSTTKEKQKLLKMSTTTEIDMPGPEFEQYQIQRRHLSVDFWDACISASLYTCVFGSGILVALAITITLVYFLVTTDNQ